MAENIEKKPSQNLSNPGEDFLDWNDYDEEYEEEDNKGDFKNENQNQEDGSYHKKDSSEYEEDTYNDSFNPSKTNKDYSYSNNNFKKSYQSSYHRGSFGGKKFKKQSKPFNKGYDNNYNYNFHRNTFYGKKRINSDIYNNNKDYYKYKDHNYEQNKEYKTVEKMYEYNNQDNYDKKSDKYFGKKFGYNSKYKNNNDYNYRNTLSYSTRGFFDDDKKVNSKNSKYKNEYKHNGKEEELNEKSEEENISKPLFYNSKINNNKIEETPVAPVNQQKYIKTEDFIQIENLVNNINKIVRDTYINLKSKMNIDEQYGMLNIHAKSYVPKRKILRENNMINNNINNNINYGQNDANYGPNIVNNNISNQNYISEYL